ncbi:MAG: hypothetical protein P9L92_05350 [Candidatus Electryonea clarkiae]|nr:hypothetical protein [Candidatus Electryonea clarkiae]
MIRRKIIVCLIIFLLSMATVYGQHTENEKYDDDMAQARMIRIKRMSEAWSNEKIELRLNTGKSDIGNFVSIRNNSFQLATDRGMMQFPVADVESLVLKRKPQDLLLAGLASLGIASLLGGGASLGFEATDEVILGAAGIGACIGFTLGWKAFYQNIVVMLD